MDLNEFSEDTFWCVKYGPEDLVILRKCNKICITVYYVRITTALIMTWTSALAVGIGILMCITLESSTGIQLLNSCIFLENMGQNKTERRLTLEPPAFLD